MIVEFIIYLRDEKRNTCSSIKVYLAAILRFFQINNDDFNLTIKSFRIHLPPDDSVNEDRPYTTEEIAKILQNCDLRSKVIFLLLVSTGMRRGAMHLLRIGDLLSVTWNGNNRLYKIQVYARTRDKYYTFCTPETRKAIDEYLEYRTRCKEVLKDESPLIREQFNKDNPFTINSPRFVSQKAIEYIIDDTLEKAGVRKPGLIHLSHGFRKFFVSQCEGTPMKSVHVSLLSGHDIGVKKHYYVTKESVVLEDYMTHAVDALTIDPKQRLEQENQELKTVQAEEIARLKAHLEAREEKDRKTSEEWQALKREMDELRKFVFPGPVPQDKQMRETYLKFVRSYYKDEKGLDVNIDDVSNNLE
jgi:integrase